MTSFGPITPESAACQKTVRNVTILVRIRTLRDGCSIKGVLAEGPEGSVYSGVAIYGVKV